MMPREKSLLLIGLIILIVVAGLKYFVLPGIDNYFTLINKLEETSFELKKAQLQVKSANKYTVRLARLSSSNSSLADFFYQGQPLDVRLEILQFLDSEIRKAGLEIKSKEFIINNSDGINNLSGNEANSKQLMEDTIGSEQSLGDKAMVVKMPVKLTFKAQLKGSYQELLTFLESLKNSHKYYSVSQLDIKPGMDKNRLTTFIVIDSYCLRGGKDV